MSDRGANQHSAGSILRQSGPTDGKTALCERELVAEGEC
jgi:hypothetical protein